MRNTDRTNTGHRVVIVGGGFGGLETAKNLSGSGLEISVIDQRNHHIFQPLLYQVATASLATSEIAWPIRSILARKKDVTTMLGTVTGVDADARQVLLMNGMRVPYDTLVLATGATHAYFGRDDWAPHAPGLKTIEDATTLRRRILSAFERAEMSHDPAERASLMTFVVIGAGPTGVELAGTIAELSRSTLPKEFRRIDTREARIILLEAGQQVLSGFAKNLSHYAKTSLEGLGVEVQLGEAVTEIDAAGVTVGAERIECETIIWAAGVKASPAADWMQADADRAGRVLVTDHLTLQGHPDVFAIGDTVNVAGPGGRPVPGIAPAAKQQGQYVARTIKKRLRGQDTKPFIYRHKGSLAQIGKRSAIIEFDKVQLKGWLAWWIWGVAHIFFLIEMRARVLIAVNWLWTHTLNRRGSRLITQSESSADRKDAPDGRL
ncbi:NAD(P)/FAD-dependent oxidoreductase [Sulfitobacter sp. F26169L]|uniref:NAD(P)/FAD-dependent oxidoreductase n=1 Tax=Sulfitobacter sp. F26169L TaxID=2996015 RepID=UPI002260EEB8|nr:NAD(P)/FAD-dependent oxidoreductase [Sulfitobacter sp. F26169L]MCX7567483.1 NAD(P)/FAD-dependent oxidoreductase [Sulfitobacter sp. F26169L]